MVTTLYAVLYQVVSTKYACISHEHKIVRVHARARIDAYISVHVRELSNNNTTDYASYKVSGFSMRARVTVVIGPMIAAHTRPA